MSYFEISDDEGHWEQIYSQVMQIADGRVHDWLESKVRHQSQFNPIFEDLKKSWESWSG